MEEGQRIAAALDGVLKPHPRRPGARRRARPDALLGELHPRWQLIVDRQGLSEPFELAILPADVKLVAALVRTRRRSSRCIRGCDPSMPPSPAPRSGRSPSLTAPADQRPQLRPRPSRAAWSPPSRPPAAVGGGTRAHGSARSHCPRAPSPGAQRAEHPRHRARRRRGAAHEQIARPCGGRAASIVGVQLARHRPRARTHRGFVRTSGGGAAAVSPPPAAPVAAPTAASMARAGRETLPNAPPTRSSRRPRARATATVRRRQRGDDEPSRRPPPPPAARGPTIIDVEVLGVRDVERALPTSSWTRLPPSRRSRWVSSTRVLRTGLSLHGSGGRSGRRAAARRRQTEPTRRPPPPSRPAPP